MSAAGLPSPEAEDRFGPLLGEAGCGLELPPW